MNCEDQFKREDLDQYPCADCPWQALQTDDNLALWVWGLVRPLADSGLAPLALEVLGLRLRRHEAVELVRRLGILAQHEVRMTQHEAERARREAERGRDAR